MKVKYEKIEDIKTEYKRYPCGRIKTDRYCNLPSWNEDSCGYGWYDKETNTIRCCAFD